MALVEVRFLLHSFECLRIAQQHGVSPNTSLAISSFFFSRVRCPFPLATGQLIAIISSSREPQNQYFLEAILDLFLEFYNVVEVGFGVCVCVFC